MSSGGGGFRRRGQDSAITDPLTGFFLTTRDTCHQKSKLGACREKGGVYEKYNIFSGLWQRFAYFDIFMCSFGFSLQADSYLDDLYLKRYVISVVDERTSASIQLQKYVSAMNTLFTNNSPIIAVAFTWPLPTCSLKSAHVTYSRVSLKVNTYTLAMYVLCRMRGLYDSDDMACKKACLQSIVRYFGHRMTHLQKLFTNTDQVRTIRKQSKCFGSEVATNKDT